MPNNEGAYIEGSNAAIRARCEVVRPNDPLPGDES